MPAGQAPHDEMRWHHEDLPLDAVERAAVADDRLLFYMVAGASFVEITTDLYTRNLIEYFQGDEEVQGWLEAGWEPEELQHGQALRRYVAAAWPDFDWETAYRAFFAEYKDCCQVEFLGPTRALEMARRCIVEMGTCTYYTMITRFTRCPVLAELAENIRTDEASHYRHFHDYFLRYRAEEKPSRPRVLRALVARIREIDGEDGYLAFKHVWQASNPRRPFEKRYYRRFTRAVRGLAAEHYPFRMAVHMTSKPLGLPLRAQRWIDGTVAAGAHLAARMTGAGPTALE